MKQYAIIVAGGNGSRMGGGMPKQFRSLCGHPVLWWSMKAFYDENPETTQIIVLPESFMELWKDFSSTLPEEEQIPHKIVAGGDTRTESVKKGLSEIEEDESIVAIHDGARPLIKVSQIKEGWETAKKEQAAIPVVALTDSLRIQEGGRSRAIDRNKFMAVQTPQVFHTKLLKESYHKAGAQTFTDDATVVENAGHKIALYSGDVDNLKITNPKDLAIAAVIMGKDA